MQSSDAVAQEKPTRKQEEDQLQSYRERLNRNVRPSQPARGQTSYRPSSIEDTPSSSAPIKPRAWDATPRSSATVKNKSWEATPSRRTEPREWDTPSRSDFDTRRDGTHYPEEISVRGGAAGREWEEEQLRLDRDWYNDDDEPGNPFADYEDDAEAAQVSSLQSQAQQITGRRKMSAKAAAYQQDNDMWEVNRLAQSGVTGERRRFDLDQLAIDEEESRVHLLVHDLKPPFLDGRITYTKQLEPVSAIKDPTSDLAIFSKKGSALVSERRAKAEREKANRKVAQLGGTSLGNLLGVKEEPEGEFGLHSPRSVVIKLTTFHATESDEPSKFDGGKSTR